MLYLGNGARQTSGYNKSLIGKYIYGLSIYAKVDDIE